MEDPRSDPSQGWNLHVSATVPTGNLMGIGARPAPRPLGQELWRGNNEVPDVVTERTPPGLPSLQGGASRNFTRQSATGRHLLHEPRRPAVHMADSPSTHSSQCAAE